MNNSESKALEQKPPFEVIMESEDQSYVHIFRDGKIWIGAIERTIALEIVRKLNALDKAESENQRLTEELKEMTEVKDSLISHQEPLYNSVKKNMDEVERLTKINEELVKALEIIPPEKFIILADWLDVIDKKDSSAGDEVQRDLRKFAIQVKETLETHKRSVTPKSNEKY